jgi:hypothetical protein
VLAKAQRHSKLFVAQPRVVGREARWKIPDVMAGPSVDSAFEKPFADSIFRATTHLAYLVEQRRDMNGIAEPSG